MANWSHTNSQGWGDFSEGWEATINGTRFSIVVDARTGKGTLYRSAPGNAPIKVKDGPVEQLKRYAETLRFSRPNAKDTMAQPKFKVGDKVRNTNGDVIGVVAEMWTDNNSEPVYRLIDESKRGIGQFKERHLIRASRPGAKDTMAVEDRFYFGK